MDELIPVIYTWLYINKHLKNRPNMASKKSTTKNNSSKYARVAPNIYRDGSSFRVRVSVNGVRLSRNLETKTAAIRWRNEMLADQD